MNNDTKFQKLINIVSKTLGLDDDCAMVFIKNQCAQEGLKDFISEKFHKFIGEQIEISRGKINPRLCIKSILCYPDLSKSLKIPQLELKNDEDFQEFIRIIDATTANYNKDGLITGWNAMNLIVFIYRNIPLAGLISTDFELFIGNEIKLAEGKTNAREHVKKILMYPDFAYLPWNKYETEIDFTAAVEDVKFAFRLVHGKVYAHCTSPINLVDVIYDKMLEVDPETFGILEKNSETCHITLVNSNIVHDLGVDKVQEFLETFHEETFSVTTKNINWTISRDWLRFSNCYVIEIQSDNINKFLGLFNDYFGTSLKPTPHITFAIYPRDLFI